MDARLLMLVHAYYPLGEPRVEREAKVARDAGLEVEVLCLRGEDEPARETVDGISVRRLPLSHKRGASVGRILWEYLAFAALATIILAARRRRPNVVHVHAPPDFLIVAALPLRLRGSRVVLDIHDLSPHMYDARFEGRTAGRLVNTVLRALQTLACSLAHSVITVHDPYRDELVRGRVRREKVTVVMNSADERLIERVAAARIAAGGDAFTLAYHGTITHWYGVDLIVTAVAELRERLPEVRALVLGAGDALDDARRRAQDLGVADRIEFSGTYLPIEEALVRVAGADCGVIPNRPSTLNRFALSSKLFEYVALGTPAVVSRLETLAAYFSPEEVTFFEPGDPRSLADSVAWVAANPEAARERAARAQERAREYSWSENGARYVGLLEALAG